MPSRDTEAVADTADRGDRPRRRGQPADAEAAVLAQLAAMPEPDRVLGEQLHELIKAVAPALASRLWYGMPAYTKNGKVICFYQAASKFKTRYATLGFMHDAKLDAGALWPTAYAIIELTPEVEATVRELVSRAAG